MVGGVGDLHKKGWDRASMSIQHLLASTEHLRGMFECTHSHNTHARMLLAGAQSLRLPRGGGVMLQATRVAPTARGGLHLVKTALVVGVRVGLVGRTGRLCLLLIPRFQRGLRGLCVCEATGNGRLRGARERTGTY